MTPACGICWEAAQDTRLACGHAFCYGCLEEWFRRQATSDALTCPYCTRAVAARPCWRARLVQAASLVLWVLVTLLYATRMNLFLLEVDLPLRNVAWSGLLVYNALCCAFPGLLAGRILSPVFTLLIRNWPVLEYAPLALFAHYRRVCPDWYDLGLVGTRLGLWVSSCRCSDLTLEALESTASCVLLALQWLRFKKAFVHTRL